MLTFVAFGKSPQKQQLHAELCVEWVSYGEELLVAEPDCISTGAIQRKTHYLTRIQKDSLVPQSQRIGMWFEILYSSLYRSLTMK